MGNLAPDSLWERAESLLSPHPPQRYKHPGRRPAGDRPALAGIAFALKTGIHWNQLPRDVLGVSNDVTQLLPLVDAIPPIRGPRGTPHGSGLGRHRWIVERGFAWLLAYKRLRTRWKRRTNLHSGLLQLTCVLIYHRQLTP